MTDLYLLQRHFGIGADEALYERPAWELDNLLAHYARERQEEGG